MRLKKIQYFKLMKNLTLFFALLISFWIPQYKFVLSLFIVLWLIISVFQFNISKRFITNYKNEKKITFILQVVFFLLLFLGYFISNNKTEASGVIVKKLSFIVFPVLFVLSGKQFSERKHIFLSLFVLGNIVAALISFFYALYNSINFESNKLLFDSVKDESNNFFTYTTFSVFHHPAYFSMYIVFSIAILFYLKKKSIIFNSHKKNILFWLIIIFFALTIFFLSSRAGMLSLLLLLSWKMYNYLKKHNKTFIKIASIVLFLVSLLFLSQNARVIRTYNEVTNVISQGKNYKHYPSRLFLWESAIEVISENFWLGTGTGDTKEMLSEKTKKYKHRDKDITKLNAHNQFLEIFMSSGIIGFLIFISILIICLLKAIKSNNELFILFLTIIIFNFLFESMLNTIAGIVFFVYFLNYFMFVFINDKINNENL